MRPLKQTAMSFSDRLRHQDSCFQAFFHSFYCQGVKTYTSYIVWNTLLLSCVRLYHVSTLWRHYEIIIGEAVYCNLEYMSSISGWNLSLIVTRLFFMVGVRRPFSILNCSGCREKSHTWNKIEIKTLNKSDSFTNVMLKSKIYL